MDISGAEVRAISYIAKDKYMLDCYEKKLDPYITLAKQLDPGKDDGYYKSIRGNYKTILLGALYGMGIPTMAERAGLTVEDATRKYHAMFENMSGIKQLIKDKGDYCISHKGYVESYLGDVLEMDSGDESRLGRLGINQFVQNIAAVSLADGFYNNIICSDRKIIPVNVVHDSSQNYLPANMLFDIKSFYDKHLTDYLMEKYGINYLFDLEIGTNYYDMCDLSQIDKDHLMIKGPQSWLMNILKRCDESGLEYKIDKIQNKAGEDFYSDGKFSDEFKANIPSPMNQYIGEAGNISRFHQDLSSFMMYLSR